MGAKKKQQIRKRFDAFLLTVGSQPDIQFCVVKIKLIHEHYLSLLKMRATPQSAKITPPIT